MAELGETRNPAALVPGQPAAIENNVAAIRSRSRSMEQAGDNLKRIDSDAWQGEAADSFRDKFTYEPSRWHRASDAFEHAATALSDYAETLRWAQGQAAEAIALYDEADAATRQAKAEYDRTVAEAAAQNQANATSGEPSRLEVAAFVDPGDEKRQAARDMLHRARQQLTEAGDRAASTIRERGDEAPEESWWSDIGDGLATAGDFVADFGAGVWDTVSGTGELLWDLSPHHLLTNPDAYDETWEQLRQTAASAWNDPAAFLEEAGKSAIGWEHWKNGDPGRAIGQIVSGAALGYGAGKVASIANRLRTDNKPDADDNKESTETPAEAPPGVQPGWESRTADNGKGTVYQRPGATGNADSIRIMDQSSRYPHGYVRFYNEHGQPVDLSGKPGPRPDTHIPRNPDGSYPVPEGW